MGYDAVEVLCSDILCDARYQLESLNLEDCQLGDDCAECFGKILLRNDNLRVLNLSRNGITSKGMELFAADLHKSMLVVLMLHWNPLGSKGGQFIAKALVENTML